MPGCLTPNKVFIPAEISQIGINSGIPSEFSGLGFPECPPRFPGAREGQGWNVLLFQPPPMPFLPFLFDFFNFPPSFQASFPSQLLGAALSLDPGLPLGVYGVWGDVWGSLWVTLHSSELRVSSDPFSI